MGHARGAKTALAAALAVLVTAAAPAGPAAAQGTGEGALVGGELSALRERQEQLFQQLIQDPDNLDLMFDYAKTSIRLEDYEAAISTLERMLIYRQDLSRVRLELAVAYFNLGSYEVSDLYFDQVLADPSTPDTVRGRIDRFKEQIALRTDTSGFTGTLNVGLTYSTNATLGPEDEVIVDFGGGPVLLNITEGDEEDDFGVKAVFSGTHIYDLRRANSDFWRTDVSALGLRYFNESQGNTEFIRLRTGPSLSLDDQQYGPKIRPYVQGSYLRSNDESLFISGGVGAGYSNTISQTVSLFADAGLRYRDYFQGQDDEDALTLYSLVGAAYRPERDLVFRGSLIFERDFARESFNSNFEVGARASVQYQYDSGLDWVDRKWVAAGYAEVRGRFYDDDDPFIGLNRDRRDLDLRAGVSHVFALQDGFGIQFDLDSLYRDSNIVNFDLDNISATISAQYRF